MSTQSPTQTSHHPFFLSLHGYKSAWITTDILAAVMLFVIAVPEQLATARLAGMPLIDGFYAFIAGSLLIAILGANPQMSVGADSTIAPLMVVGLTHFAPAQTDHYIALMALLAVCVGLIVGLVGLFRLGWIANFLSTPIITGFLSGVGIIIIVHQLSDFFGLPSASGSTLARIQTVGTSLSHTNLYTFGIGVGVITIIVISEKFNKKIPGALIGLILSSLAVALFGLKAHGVDVLGTVAHGLPSFGLKDLSFSSLAQVAPLSLVVALVVISQSAATSRAFSHGQRGAVDVGRDFLGVGAGSILAGLFGGFAVDASPARTAAVNAAGGKSQLSGLFAAGAVLLLIPAMSLLVDLPLATLAAVLIYVATRIFHFGDLKTIFHFDSWEFGLALVTLLIVAFVGVEQGIAIAIVLAILDRTRVSARPKITLLGKVAGTTSWEALSRSAGATAIDGVVVILFPAPLYFANAEFFRETLRDSITTASPPVQHVVLDAAGMSDVDYTGVESFASIIKILKQRGITFALARPTDTVKKDLSRSGLIPLFLGAKLFDTVNDAVEASIKSPSPTPAFTAKEDEPQS